VLDSIATRGGLGTGQMSPGLAGPEGFGACWPIAVLDVVINASLGRLTGGLSV